MTDCEDGRRRRLFTIAVRDYPQANVDAAELFATAIDSQVAVLTEWFCDADLKQRSFEHVDLAPATRRDINAFVEANDLDRLGPADIAVVYVTGHGIKGESGHFLMFGDSDETHPLATGYRTSGLLTAVLATDADHVLVLVDSCHAGVLDAEWARIRMDLPKARRALPTLAVIASADFDEKPRIGEFASLLREVHQRLRSAEIVDPHLNFTELMTEIGAVLADHRNLTPPLEVWVPNRFESADSLCLPNPGYKPSIDVVDAPRRQVAAPASTLDDYWKARASGRVAAGDAGWYFSGRAELNVTVVEFLRAGSGLLVVTGTAGSGKSAVLARAVTLSDSTFVPGNSLLLDELDPAQIPPTGSIDAAVLAREKDVSQLLVDLINALGGHAETGRAGLDDLTGLLTARGVARTVVIDGVDEARYPSRVVTDIIGPLSRVRHPVSGAPLVRLLLGIRSATAPVGEVGATGDAGSGLLDLLHRAAGSADLRLVRTDEQPTVTNDIAAYVSALLGVSGPYVDDLTAAAEAARVIAERVTPSFLDARLAGRQLREADIIQEPRDSDWLVRLSDGTVALFRADLAAVVEATSYPVDHVLAVLRATAFALGRGLPRSQIWPTVAAAVLGASLPNSEPIIDEVLSRRLAGYLSQDVEDGRIVHRPSHERLAEELRDPAQLASASSVRSQSDTRAVHARITDALAALIDSTGTLPPHPYLRRYLLEHADRGAILDDRHIPAAFGAWEQGLRLRGLLGLPLPTNLDGSSRLAAWARIEPYLADHDVPTRRSSLKFAELATGLAPAADVSAPIEPRWAQWQLPAGNVLGVMPDSVSALTSLTLPDGRVLVAGGDRGGRVWLWDVVTGERVGELSTGSGGEVMALAVVPVPDGRVLLAGGGGGRVWLWDVVTGDRVRKLSTGFDIRVSALAVVLVPDGRVLLAGGGRRGDWGWGVWLWDAVTGDQVGELSMSTGSVGEVSALAVVPVPDGRVLLAGSDGGGRVWLWDVVTGDRVHELSTGSVGGVSALAVVPVPDGRVLLAGGVVSGQVWLWEVVIGDRVGGLSTGSAGGVSALAVVSVPGGRVLLAGGVVSGQVWLWDGVTGDRVHELSTGSFGGVSALAVVPVPDGRVLLAGGGVVSGQVWLLASLTLSDGRVLLASGDGGTLRLWDPVAGLELHRLVTAGVVAVIAQLGTNQNGRVEIAIGGPAGLAVLSINEHLLR